MGGRKTSQGSRRMKDSTSQKRRKKRLAHFGGKSQPMEFMYKSINDHWDHRRTLAQNYASMGLATDPNRAMPIVPSRKEQQADKQVSLKTLAVVEELDEVANAPPVAPYQVKSMSINEQKRLQTLISKHGEDISAMSRDIKINVNQETEAQLRKRIALYKKLQSL